MYLRVFLFAFNKRSTMDKISQSRNKKKKKSLYKYTKRRMYTR